MSTTVLKPFADRLTAAAGKLPAAPAMTMSILPNFSTVAFSEASIASYSRTSAERPIASPPLAATISLAAFSAFTGSRPTTTTFAPCCAKPMAIPKLMPLVPPAT
jgi:hypothetical protein